MVHLYCIRLEVIMYKKGLGILFFMLLGYTDNDERVNQKASNASMWSPFCTLPAIIVFHEINSDTGIIIFNTAKAASKSAHHMYMYIKAWTTWNSTRKSSELLDKNMKV